MSTKAICRSVYYREEHILKYVAVLVLTFLKTLASYFTEIAKKPRLQDYFEWTYFDILIIE